ncbi:hypothetical protein ACH5RR_031278 [Cinchona calisaya]|uniref:Membrane-associated kinase regulator 1 n=1 Tax=Cinchona calisaya TaxID=153742 RepID=A0ABD2YER9_9GENT
MGKRTHKDHPKSHTLPSSPTRSFSSSSSSDFEFTISLSPRNKATTNLCPADDLFYKGQLLPLHLSPRISMVRTLLLASSSTSSSSDTTTTASRDSTGSSNDSHSSFSSDLILLPDCDSSRPSSVTEEDDNFKRTSSFIYPGHHQTATSFSSIKKTKYFSRLSRFSSVFRKESTSTSSSSSKPSAASSVKRMSATAKEVIRKYLKKVKPLYEKLSQKQQQQKMATTTSSSSSSSAIVTFCMKNDADKNNTSSLLPNGKKEMVNSGSATIAHSFSGNLRYPRRMRRSCVSSCPSSMRSSPSHSGILCKTGFITPPMNSTNKFTQDTSSMEELQNAIQGAIAHCKNSMLQNNKGIMVSNEI